MAESRRLHLFLLLLTAAIVKCFIELEADLETTVVSGETIFHSATEGDNTDVIKFLLTISRAKTVVLATDADRQHYITLPLGIRTVKLLVNLGADINAKNSKGLATLHVACAQARVNVVTWLVAQPRLGRLATDEDGYTIFDWGRLE